MPSCIIWLYVYIQLNWSGGLIPIPSAHRESGNKTLIWWLCLSIRQVIKVISKCSFPQNTATVTILQNDNAEGIFFISNATRGPFIFPESSSDIIVITIEREGGALTNQLMRYEIPDGSQDLIGGFGFANFIANQRSFTVTILINDDTIPEIDETFIFTISAVDGNEGILGSPTSVTITLLANDDFAGVFLFAASSLSLFVGESDTIMVLLSLS